jgi:hypothetical protein
MKGWLESGGKAGGFLNSCFCHVSPGLHSSAIEMNLLQDYQSSCIKREQLRDFNCFHFERTFRMNALD